MFGRHGLATPRHDGLRDPHSFASVAHGVVSREHRLPRPPARGPGPPHGAAAQMHVLPTHAHAPPGPAHVPQGVSHFLSGPPHAATASGHALRDVSHAVWAAGHAGPISAHTDGAERHSARTGAHEVRGHTHAQRGGPHAVGGRLHARGSPLHYWRAVAHPSRRRIHRPAPGAHALRPLTPPDPGGRAVEEYDKRRFRSIEETDRFLDAHECPGAAIAAASRRLKATRVALEKLMREESEAKMYVPWDGKEIRGFCAALRKEHMLRISKAAKRIRGFDRFTPGAAAALRVPHARAHADVLVPSAERMARWLKPHVRLFVEEAGFDKTFVADLRSAAKRLKERAGTADSARKRRSAAIAAIKVELTNGRQDIDLLRVLMEPWLLANSREVLAWENVTRVPTKLGRPKKKRRRGPGLPAAEGS